MSRLLVVHWNPEDAALRAAGLRRAGHEVALLDRVPEKDSFAKLARTSADAVVIDLSRAPARGRDVALWLRARKAWRTVPFVFIACNAADEAKLRALLPDASFATWRGVRGAVQRALNRPATTPPPAVQPLAGYSGTPLPKKLGIKPGSTVALIGAPDGFEKTLGTLPDDVRVVHNDTPRAEVRLLFARSVKELDRRLPRAAPNVGRGVRLWILWPKQASGIATDVKEPIVRREGLATGLVDFKIAAIDATWSGLCFARRRDA